MGILTLQNGLLAIGRAILSANDWVITGDVKVKVRGLVAVLQLRNDQFIPILLLTSGESRKRRSMMKRSSEGIPTSTRDAIAETMIPMM